MVGVAFAFNSRSLAVKCLLLPVKIMPYTIIAFINEQNSCPVILSEVRAIRRGGE